MPFLLFSFVASGFRLRQGFGGPPQLQRRLVSRKAVAVATIPLVACLAAGPALAQADARRLEVGGHFSTLQIGDAGNTNAGLGGRVSYEFLPWLAIEGELNFFPNDRLDVDSGVSSLMLQTQYSRRRLEGFVGPKIGVRGGKFGAFAKVRPGFAHLIDKGLGCVGEVCALVLLARPDTPRVRPRPRRHRRVLPDAADDRTLRSRRDRHSPPQPVRAAVPGLHDAELRDQPRDGIQFLIRGSAGPRSAGPLRPESSFCSRTADWRTTGPADPRQRLQSNGLIRTFL